ncbi:MAG TPA: DUF2127 domain-containing protein [Thermoanaerobaculia bacterium]|nr:DUF2127 domain-containing protein [Thermoanaerobaculia bacterium]
MTETSGPAPQHKKGMSAGFLAIILFKCLKGTAFLIFAIAALKLSRARAMPSAIQIADYFSVSRENELVHRVTDLIASISPRGATELGFALVLVAAFFFAEAALLAARVWWSTYFTIVLTALGIPLELYEIVHRPHAPRHYALLAINLAILLYLWARRNEFREKTG